MMIFSKDTDIARSSPAMIASYSASLLEVEKFRLMACSITSLIGALSWSPTLDPVCHEVPSTFRVHQPKLSGSISCLGISAKKLASTYPFSASEV